MSFTDLWAEIAPIGRTDGGGYLRYALSEPDLTLRDWFRTQAARRDMLVTGDGNGNLFAWRSEPWAPGTVLTGSHFDSVPHGGGYDGPLGIVSAFLAVDRLGPDRKIGVAAFTEEEGARFGVPCLGSRLLTGAIAPQRAGALEDRDGVSFATALGAEPSGEEPRLRQVKAFVELHIEQGRALTSPVGVADAIWPHGRWRFDFTGAGNDAGTTRMTDRHDPMLTYAFTVLAANKDARLSGAHATMGRVEAEPNRVSGWLDARAADTAALGELIESVTRKAVVRAGRDGTEVTVTRESVTGELRFGTGPAARIATLLDAPVLPAGIGHDAGVLSAHVPTAMLFVRNPAGVSHAPAEHADDADCEAGVEALATVLDALA